MPNWFGTTFNHSWIQCRQLQRSAITEQQVCRDKVIHTAITSVGSVTNHATLLSRPRYFHVHIQDLGLTIFTSKASFTNIHQSWHIDYDLIDQTCSELDPISSIWKTSSLFTTYIRLTNGQSGQSKKPNLKMLQ